jgi:hypothetical protein
MSVLDHERPKEVTPKAIRQCGQWLATCLELGWRQGDLDALERIWWTYRDRHGNVKPAASERQEYE